MWGVNSPHFGPTRRPRRGRLVIALAASMLLLGMMSGCSGKSDPKPADSIPTASPTPTPAHEAWKADATEEEIALFEEAALWLQNYEDGEFRYFEQGKATQEAKEFFQDTRADWQGPWELLQQRDEDGVKSINDDDRLWRKPTHFATGSEPSITIVTCTDWSKKKYEGAKVKEPGYPFQYETQMSRMKDRGWTIFSTKISGGDARCKK